MYDHVSRYFMKYIELYNENDVETAINDIHSKYKSFSQIVPSGEYETTMGGKKVVTLFYRFEPVMKVEAEETLLNLLLSKLKGTNSYK